MKRQLRIRSTSPDEFERFLRDTYAPATVKGLNGTRTFGVEGAMAVLDGALVEWSSTIGDVEIASRDTFDAVVFNLMIRRSMRHHFTKGDVELQAGYALSFRHSAKAGLLDGSQHVTLAISSDLLQKRLSALLDGANPRPVEFSPSPVPQARIRHFADLVCGLETSPMANMAALLRGKTDAIETAIVDAFLLSYPSTYSERLATPVKSIAPRHVKRAIDYIEAHPTRYHSPDMLASLSNVSVRSLQYSFKAVTSQTISEYQTLLRLRLARQEILDNPTMPLTVLARNWGFCSLSSFGLGFKKVYGVAPSALRDKS